MIRGSDINIKKIFLTLLVLSGCICAVYPQTKVSGVINKYAHVTGLGADYVIINDPVAFAQFHAADTVLLIQMKGAGIYSEETAAYGDVASIYGKPGKHEFLIIQSIDGGLKKITFRNNIVNSTFSLEGNLQIVRVPSYNSVEVTGAADLKCAPWDSISKTGGVLTMIVGRTLALNRNIDVSGLGFIGGAITQSVSGLCTGSDLVNLDKYAYNSAFSNSGYKGESLVIKGRLPGPVYPAIHPGYSKGKGMNLNGGGGGNGRFAGGGGGSNYGAGGIGGFEKNDCSPTYLRAGRGLGGRQIVLTPLDGGIFMGGGGGSSTYMAGSTASPGGNGGGIVIIIADTITTLGAGKSIIANGASASTASLNAGAGGGGAGGSVALYLQSFSRSPLTSTLLISANGGAGGNNTGTFGEGGGGGGGLVTISNITTPAAYVTHTASSGAAGIRAPGVPGQPGAPGSTGVIFTPILNGFLFNSIRSSITLDQVDSICSDVIPKEIKGTAPVGGTGSYSYSWQKSYNLLGPPADIPLATSINYVPTAKESNTVWFRRIVKDDGTLLTDTSKWVKIIVQTAITGNLVGKDTTICYNQNPESLIPLNTGPSNGSSYNYYYYQWQDSIVSSVKFVTSSGTITNPGYDPPALLNTTYLRRKVTSGRCVSYSPVVTITVLPLITGNITIRSDSVICQGSIFNNLGASPPSGGNSVYKYQWQDSIVSSVKFLPAAGANTGTIYSPDTATFAVEEQRYLRRVVFSGPDSVCQDRSIPILLTRYHKIKNNAIIADQVICSGDIPTALSGTVPQQGKSGDYTYIWQDSSRVSATWTARATSDFSFPPPSLTDTTWYRRVVNSGVYKSATVCTNRSLPVRIDVHKPIIDNFTSLISGPGPDTTVCSGAIPDSVMGSKPSGGTGIPNDYAFLWETSTVSDVSGFAAAPGINNRKSYKPESLLQTTWLRRRVISGMCETFSNSIRVIVLPPVTNNIISSDQTICVNATPLQITGTPLTGGAGGVPAWLWKESSDGVTWNNATGIANQQNYSPPALSVPMKYMRIIHSGLYDCCIDTSNVISINIHPPLPTGEILTTSDTTICEGSAVRLRIHLTGESAWRVIYTENAKQVTVNNFSGPGDLVVSSTPVPGAAITQFNYSLFSVEDKNGCFATGTSLTGTRKADVYKNPTANAGGPILEICGPTITLNAIPSVGAGTWYYPAEVIASTVNNPSVTVTVDSLFTGSSIAPWFIWEEKNWLCPDKDSVKVIFYKRISSINAGLDTTLYSFDNIFHMEADPLLTWETGLWSVLSGSGNFADASDNLSEVTNLAKQTNTFQWEISNGVCSMKDLVNIDVKELLIPEGFSPNGDIFNNTFTITGLDLPNQIAEMSIVNSAGAEVYSASNRDGQTWTDWDGKNMKGFDLPEGTYYYLLKITSRANGQVFKQNGFIVLKRY